MQRPLEMLVNRHQKCDSQAHHLPADGIQVGQAHELVVLQILAAILRASLEQLCAQLVLDVGVETEQVQDSCNRIRSGVGAGECECPARKPNQRSESPDLYGVVQ